MSLTPACSLACSLAGPEPARAYPEPSPSLSLAYPESTPSLPRVVSSLFLALAFPEPLPICIERVVPSVPLVALGLPRARPKSDPKGQGRNKDNALGAG